MYEVGWRFYRGMNWDTIKYQVMARDGFQCRCCSATDKLHVHHIVEWNGDERLNHKGNLVTLCNSCHVGGHRRNCFMFYPVAAFLLQNVEFSRVGVR